MFQDIIPTPGDLILVQAKTQNKSPNRIAQTILAAKRATYSHLAIAIDGAFALHSMPEEGVHEIEIQTLLSPTNTSAFAVLRHRDLDGNKKLQTELREALFYHLEEPYNLKFYLRLKRSGSDCSEFAAKAYARIDRPLMKRWPQFVLPVHVERLFGSRSWLDVTALYRAGLEPQPTSALKEELDHILGPIRERVRSAQLLALEMERAMRRSSRHQNSVAGVAQLLAKLGGVPPPPLPKTRPYWDSPALSRRRNPRQ